MAALWRPAWRPTRRGLCIGVAGAVLLGASSRPWAEDAPVPDWVVGDHTRVRLIDAGVASTTDSRRLVGLQIELDPGYLTYWRSPGEAGLPPTFDTAGSVNLKSLTPLFPAPRRYSEDGAEAFGYKDGVVIPMLVEAAEPTKPLDLHLALGFAICERQCLPAGATLRLKPTGDGRTPDAALVRAVLAQVPATARIGQSGPLAILAVQGVAGDDQLTVLAHTDGTEVPALFVEADAPWFVQAGEGLWSNDGSLKYRVAVLSKPPEPAALPLRLTLVGAEHAIEVAVTLDAPPAKP